MSYGIFSEFFLLDKVLKLVNEGSVINGAYPIQVLGVLGLSCSFLVVLIDFGCSWSFLFVLGFLLNMTVNFLKHLDFSKI